ncbi:MAG: hypothetical protein WCE73_14385 [Candidatus Angelobacter sp.]
MCVRYLIHFRGTNPTPSTCLCENTQGSLPAAALADLTLAIASINAWNRLAIAARSVPGKYQPLRSHELHKSA